MASSSSSSVVFARARAAFDLLSAGDLGLVGALSWKLLDVSFLNVCATDLNGEFSSRSPCATTARVAMRCVLAKEGVVGLVDGFAGATRPGPLLAAARLAATRMRSFSSAAAARDLSNASSSDVFCAARARLGGRERFGDIGTVSLAWVLAPYLPRSPAEDRDACVRGGAGSSRSRLAPAIAAARAAIARVVLVATAGATRPPRAAAAGGFASATGATEALTRRGFAGDVALLSPAASAR
mmetsp:Transcript_3897/g.17303  ORF Transcript_3897/g.17303 Transcript_3897/m.17303 type:complete len:240 (+) Transcript_3897:2360-3079(+)